jgi:tripartite-type tricarboxylate transporter receptor subunit TctC
VFESPYGIAGPKGMDPKIVLKIQNAYKKALDDPAVIALMDRYEMLRGSFMDSVAYTKFVADYMVSEKENLTQLGLMKKD